MYDAIVIGARSAGSSTAMLLARRGYRVLLVDRATFPSDTPSGHYIHQPGVARLARWGLLDQVAASGCPPVPRFTLDLGPLVLTGSPPPADGITDGYAPRQTILATVLSHAATAAGAELREGFSVQEVLWDGDRVVGVSGRTAGGATVTERARIVIGADGLHSRFARLVQAPAYNECPSLTAAWWSYWSGVPLDAAELHLRPNRAFGAFPTNDGLACVFVTVPNREVAAFRDAIETSFITELSLTPRLAERVHAGRREERLYGATDTPNFFRRPYGPGWALVGDAGVHKDPYMALGVCDALRDAELLVDALDDGFAARAAFAEALAGYERRRNEATLPDYQQNMHLARFEPLPEEMARIRAAVRGDQEATNQYIMAIEGLIPPETFFNPQNLSRLMADMNGGQQAVQSPAAPLGAIAAP